jgi:hypothetical protein
MQYRKISLASHTAKEPPSRTEPIGKMLVKMEEYDGGSTLNLTFLLLVRYYSAVLWLRAR